MQHLASPPMVATLVVEKWTNLAVPLALVFVIFSLANVLAFCFALALDSLCLLLRLLGLAHDVLVVDVDTARTVRTWLSVAEVKAQKQLFTEWLFWGRRES